MLASRAASPLPAGPVPPRMPMRMATACHTTGPGDQGARLVAPIIYGPGHGSARRQEDRDHRRPHRRLAGVRCGATRPAGGRGHRVDRRREGAHAHTTHGTKARRRRRGVRTRRDGPPTRRGRTRRSGRQVGARRRCAPRDRLRPRGVPRRRLPGCGMGRRRGCDAHLHVFAEGARRCVPAAHGPRWFVRRARLRQQPGLARLQLDGRREVGVAERVEVPGQRGRSARHPFQPGGRGADQDDGRQVDPGIRPVRGHLGRTLPARLGRHRFGARRPRRHRPAVRLVPRHHRRDHPRRRWLPRHGRLSARGRPAVATAAPCSWQAGGTVDGVNRLADETSPYLRQHRDNPVDWYPWGEDAFAAARQRGVPILLSVGYSACHWCHVMAHDCFEDDEVAAKMNELYVNVKVDREERPDVDALYMDAVQALTGRGGWPMTVFLTPEREPSFGGTYYPKESFLKLLDAIDDAYRNKPDDITKNTTALVKALDAT